MCFTVIDPINQNNNTLINVNDKMPSKLQNERTEHIFKKNKTKHKMKTKKSNIYKIKHANTKRFQNSAIIYMQNLLNSRIRYC